MENKKAPDLARSRRYAPENQTGKEAAKKDTSPYRLTLPLTEHSYPAAARTGFAHVPLYKPEDQASALKDLC